MNSLLRTAAAVLALALAGFGLTACTDTEDDCDAAGTRPIVVAAAANLVDGNGPGGKSRSGKSGSSSAKSGKSKSHSKVHGSDDCEDDA